MFFSVEDINDLTSISGGAQKVASIEEAFMFCERIAKKHYENFPVGSFVVPKYLRRHFYSVYTYSRLADDIADEYVKTEGKALSLDKIDKLENFLNSNFSQTSGNPVFIALATTIKELSIPIKPFLDLLVAFRMDIDFEQANTFDDLMEYCKYSANPIGEIVLRMFGEYDNRKALKSDAICTALQLTNFWQDFSRDLPDGRLFIPKSFMKMYDLSINDLLNTEKKRNLQTCLNDLFKLTYELFEKGRSLPTVVKSARLGTELKMIILGGEKMLAKIVRLNSDLMVQRPKLNKADLVKILFKSLIIRNI